jgi:hypothetical protein
VRARSIAPFSSGGRLTAVCRASAGISPGLYSLLARGGRS